MGKLPNPVVIVTRVNAIVLVCMLLSLPCTVRSEDAVLTYSLDDCLRIGLERSGAAANARRDEAIADTMIMQTRAEALPRLSLGADYVRLDEIQEIEFGDEAMEFGTLDNYSATAEINQLIYGGGRIGAALRAASLTQRYAHFTRLETEMTLARDIRLRFYDLLLAEAAVGVSEESVLQLTSVLRQAEDKFVNGTVSEFDVLSARVQLANEKPVMIAAKNDYDLAAAALKRTLNIDDEKIVITGELVSVPVSLTATIEEFQKTGQDMRAALIAMKAVVALRREGVVVARSAGRPRLDASFSYNGANSYRFVSFEDTWEWHWSAGLHLSWDLWDSGLTRGAVRKKVLENEKSRTELDELRKSVALEIRQSYLVMRNALESVAAGWESTELAGKAAGIARARYGAGLATRLELTDAVLALNTARLAHLRALHAHMSAVAHLQHACGTGSEDLNKGSE